MPGDLIDSRSASSSSSRTPSNGRVCRMFLQKSLRTHVQAGPVLQLVCSEYKVSVSDRRVERDCSREGRWKSLESSRSLARFMSMHFRGLDARRRPDLHSGKARETAPIRGIRADFCRQVFCGNCRQRSSQSRTRSKGKETLQTQSILLDSRSARFRRLDFKRMEPSERRSRLQATCKFSAKKFTTCCLRSGRKVCTTICSSASCDFFEKNGSGGES